MATKLVKVLSSQGECLAKLSPKSSWDNIFDTFNRWHKANPNHKVIIWTRADVWWEVIVEPV